MVLLCRSLCRFESDSYFAEVERGDCTYMIVHINVSPKISQLLLHVCIDPEEGHHVQTFPPIG